MTFLARALAGGAAVLLGVSACSGSGHKAPPSATPTTASIGTSSADWVHYHSLSGISMTKPSSWTVATASAGSLVVYIDPVGFFRRNISISHPRQAQPVTLAQFSFANRYLLTHTAGFKESGSGQVTLSGHPGQQETYSVKTGGSSSLDVLAEWTVVAGQPWLVTYTSDPGRFANGLSPTRHLIDSLTLPS